MQDINFLISLLMNASIAVSGIPLGISVPSTIPDNPPTEAASIRAGVPDVPFYSQFRDIHAPEWQKLGCGIADMAMLIGFYKSETISVDALLQEGLAAGAFLSGAGWKHKDLALLARAYGLKGESYDLSRLDMDSAFAQFKTFLKEGPVIASVYYTFDPNNSIPHLAVINGIDGDTVYYNDPARSVGGEAISVDDFTKAWKKRFIVVRP